MSKRTRVRSLWFMLVVLAVAFCGALAASAAEKVKFSKIWLGKDLWAFGGGRYAGGAEKDWHSMPGAMVGLQYSGKGDLPRYAEFVVKLDEKLAMGEYNVFVKNFYRGKMDITLGNITKPAAIKRYDWTPAVHFEINTPEDQTDRIVLRYYPTMTPNTGVKEDQGYIIQGVFITQDTSVVPFEEGRIIRMKPTAAVPAREGNVLRGGSFESGFGHGWGKAVGTTLIYGPEHLDSTTAADGKYSLKVPLTVGRQGCVLPLESCFYLLNPEGPYSLSVSLKASRTMRVSVGLKALPRDLSRSENRGGLDKTFDVGTEWARFSVTGELNKDLPAYLYAVSFGTPEKEGGTVWVDAVQLERGTPTAYQSRDEIEVGWVCPTPGHIYYDTEAAPLTLRIYNPKKLAKATLSYSVENYYATVVDKGTREIDLGGKENVDVPFEVYKAQRGIFRAVFRCAPEAESEIVYSVLTPNKHLNEMYPAGSLGVDTGVGPEGLRILKRANFSWIMSKHVVRWYVAEPERGKYVFDDTLCRNAGEAKLAVMLQLLNPDWGAQKWLQPLMKVHRNGAWPEEQKQAFLDAWTGYVTAVAAHYKPWCRHFEIWNEPNAEWNAADYGLLLKTAAAAARRGNPESVVIGFSGGGFNEKYYDDVVAAAGKDSFDVASVHFYHNNPEVHAAYAAFLKKVGRPGWNTETGPSCATFYANLPSFESVTREDSRAETLKAAYTSTRNTANNYLMTRSVGGMERYMYYFCRFTNGSPNQPSLRQGSTKECVEFDGALRANGVALSMASHFIDGATYTGAWKSDAAEGHLFTRGGETTGFLWLKEGRSITPKGGALTLYDIMGNALPAGKAHNPEGGPVYVSARAGTEDVKTLLGGLEIK